MCNLTCTEDVTHSLIDFHKLCGTFGFQSFVAKALSDAVTSTSQQLYFTTTPQSHTQIEDLRLKFIDELFIFKHI